MKVDHPLGPPVGIQSAPHPHTQVVHETPMVVMPPPAGPNFMGDQACDCSIPPGAGSEIRAARCWSIVIIVIHGVALVALGFFNYGQWVASLCGMIAGGVLLCCYKKDIYRCSSIVFIFAAVFNLVSAILWIVGGAYVLLILPIIAIGLTIPGIICGFKAVQSWETVSGIVVDPGVVTVQQYAANAVVVEMPQAGAHV